MKRRMRWIGALAVVMMLCSLAAEARPLRAGETDLGFWVVKALFSWIDGPPSGAVIRGREGSGIDPHGGAAKAGSSMDPNGNSPCVDPYGHPC
ncbi:MAG TPA: hypothetical protein PK413_06685 [Thermoanaerobaculia bacterium]|nr:hypothetical protein [Thermoanaerobaculia bacterium]